jgi:hypothetical protein
MQKGKAIMDARVKIALQGSTPADIERSQRADTDDQ